MDKETEWIVLNLKWNGWMGGREWNGGINGRRWKLNKDKELEAWE